jgi:predicted thioesterase
MKAIPPGYQAVHTLVVRQDMTVDFEQPEPELGKLHQVYSTYWMAKHIELVSRKLILPFLEPAEEGIGFELSVKHIASALPGMRVNLIAEYERKERNRIYARCDVFNELGDKIGEGTTTQVVMKRELVQEMFAALRARWEQHG